MLPTHRTLVRMYCGHPFWRGDYQPPFVRWSIREALIRQTVVARGDPHLKLDSKSLLAQRPLNLPELVGFLLGQGP